MPDSLADLLANSLVESVGDGVSDAMAVSVSGGGDYARPCLDVPRQSWRQAIQLACDELGLPFFDWLTGVDELEAGCWIVTHLWSVPDRHGLLVRALLPADDLRIASIVDIFPGAAWHERETYEMFGVFFDGHPNLRKLLLADEFEGNPLRKDFVLASRVVKDWPGSKEPGETEAGTPTRRRMLPPGVPQPGEWGPVA